MQLLSNFMANWVGEKKRKTKITESRIAARPPPARPDTPSPPFQLRGPLHPAPPALQRHLRLFGFATRFPPPHPKTNVNPRNNPITGQSLSQEPQGRARTSRCSPTASPPEHLPRPCRYLLPRRQGWRTQPPMPHFTEHPHAAPGPASSHPLPEAWQTRHACPWAGCCLPPWKRGCPAGARGSRPCSSHLPGPIFGARLRFSLDEEAESAQRSGEAAGFG